MEAEILSLDRITTESSTQARVTLSEQIIREYAEALERGDAFPPIQVFFDNTTYWLGDGFHRLKAAEQAGRDTIAVEIYPGSQREALLHAISSNETHGHRRSDADRRHAVTLMLSDEEWQQWSNVAIAHQCRVSEFLVRTLRNELQPAKERKQSPEATRKVTRKGKTFAMHTGSIGSATVRKPKAQSPAEPTPPPESEPQQATPVPSEPVAELPSIQSKTETGATALLEEPHDSMPLAPTTPPLRDPEPAATLQPQQPRSLIQAWQESNPDERQEFITTYHEELRALLAAYKAPTTEATAPQTPGEYKTWVLIQIANWKSEGKSMETIAHQLNEQNIQTFSGHGTWSRGTVSKLLAKEKQTGDR